MTTAVSGQVPTLVPQVHKGPVTSIKFLTNDIIFAANGPNLQIYHKLKLQKRIRIFGRQKVHGIEISSDGSKVIFFGGRSFACVQVDLLMNDEECKIKECAMNDWIMSMSFDYPCENCYLLTIRNIIYTIDLERSKVIESKMFSENSILYSGCIKVFKDRIIVASGTILGGVFVYDLQSKKLIHNLIGHEGSIFGVAISPEGDYVCSCSDDRSIRVWDLNTGSNLVTGWGHNSRIWQLQWFNGNMIMSCGEDSSCRLWEFIRNEKKVLYCRDVWELHLGKHVWCGDVREELQIAVTGGADGRVRLVDLAKSTRLGNWKKELVVSEISDIKGDFFKNYLQFANGLIVLTATGLCYKYENYSDWNLLFKDDDLDNFQILNSFKEENIILVTSKTGSTTILKFDENFNLTKKIKIDKPADVNGNITNVLTAKISQDSFIIFFDSPNPRDPFVTCELDFELAHEPVYKKFPKPDTRFISTCITYDTENNWLFVGSRYVTFIVYDFHNLDKFKMWKKFVKGDTITSCSIIDSNLNEIVVLMTTRDGDYFYLKFDQDFALTVLVHNRVQRGFLEGGFINDQNELVLLNFKSDTFHLWNETRQLEIFKEQCGGIHRTWHLDVNNLSKQSYNFIYNKSSNLIILNTGDQFFAESCLNNGTHGREIRDITISTTTRANGSKLILTGAEDTTIRLSELSADGAIENFSSQRRHVSGIQKVKFIHLSEYLISSAAREEFFLWKIDDSYSKLGPLISCYATLPPSTAEPDLRIMDFDTLPIYKDNVLYGWFIMNVYSDSTIKIFEFNIKTKTFKMILEDRYTRCCLWDARLILKFGKIFALIGGTDGHISIYNLTPDLQNLYQIVDETHLELISQPEEEIDLEIEAEIGRKIVNVPMFSELLIKQQVHQSGIKSNVLIQHPKDSSLMDLITGGDDNALVHTRLRFKSDDTIELSVKSFKENAASSTITSLTLVEPKSGSNTREVLVTSVDQIARLWQVDYNDGTEEIRCVANRYTTIGDTGPNDVCIFKDKTIALIGGAGLSSWEIKL